MNMKLPLVESGLPLKYDLESRLIRLLVRVFCMAWLSLSQGNEKGTFSPLTQIACLVEE